MEGMVLLRLPALLFLFSCLFNSLLLFSQINKNDIDNYRSLQSDGLIPSDMLDLIVDKYNKQLDEYKNIKEKSERKNKLEYSLKMHGTINSILSSGRVVFNDPITEYVNQVADVIKKSNPGVFDHIRIYILKSASMNASASDYGIVFVNTGLIAYLENDAQLAYILCHEFSHIVSKDNLESFLERKKMISGKGAFGSSSFDDLIDMIFLHDKTIEFKADSNAVHYYVNCGYDPKEILNSMTRLHYSYLPFSNIPFSKTFFNSGHYVIPEIFFISAVDSISSVENYKDLYHTHPNIFKRKENIGSVLKGTGDKYQIKRVSESEKYASVRELARFEVIRLELLNKDYTEAIYSSYVLLKDHPDNKYLKISIAKGLYGLTKYRNSDESHLVTKSYSKVEGESQQLHYLFRQLSKVQLNVLSLKYVTGLLGQYPEEWILKEMQKELVFELLHVNECPLDKFYNDPKEFSLPSEYNANKNLTGAELAKAQKTVSEFYLNAFCNEKKDKGFAELFVEAAPRSEKAKEYESLSFAEKEKQKELKEKEIRKKGISCLGKKTVILDPVYRILDADWEDDVLKAEESKLEFDGKIQEYINTKRVNSIFISSKNIRPDDIEQYNMMSIYKELIEELLTKTVCQVIPLANDYKYYSEQNNVAMIYIPGRYRLKNKLYYTVDIYNTLNGKREFGYYKEINSNSEANTLFLRDIQLLKP